MLVVCCAICNPKYPDMYSRSIDAANSMSSSAFGSLGLGVLKGDVYKEVLDMVKDGNLGPDVGLAIRCHLLSAKHNKIFIDI